MSTQRSIRLPISTRHAFALAFDLAARRDPIHSLMVPLALRLPWILAISLLPPLSDTTHPVQVTLLTCAALMGDFVMMLIVGAMLRFRARSVFNTPADVHPAPIVDCYSLGLRRVPWLLVTEIARNLALFFAAFFFLLPAMFLGFRLAFATEAVVLDSPNTTEAFRRSFRLTEGRFERWFEMIVVSVVLVVSIIFLMALASLLFAGSGLNTWVAVSRILITAITPIIQYAWTFFYLRLTETDAEPVIEVGPLYASPAPPAGAPSWEPSTVPPHLALVEPGAVEDEQV
jgi:hypothetical protein